MYKFRALLLLVLSLGSETVNAGEDKFDFRSWVDQKEISDMSIPSEIDIQELDIDGMRYLKVGNKSGSLLLHKKNEYQGSDIKSAYCAKKPEKDTSGSILISGITPQFDSSLLKHLDLIAKEILLKCVRIGG